SLERDLRSLESLFLGALALITAAALVLGTVLTVAVNPDWQVQRWSVLSAPIMLWGTLDNAEHVAFGLVAVLAAVLHVLAVLAAVIFCAAVPRRDAGPRLLTFGNVLVVLVAIGVGGHLLMALAAWSSDDGGPGAGPYDLGRGLGPVALPPLQDSLRRRRAGCAPRRPRR